MLAHTADCVSAGRETEMNEAMPQRLSTPSGSIPGVRMSYAMPLRLSINLRLLESLELQVARWAQQAW